MPGAVQQRYTWLYIGELVEDGWPSPRMVATPNSPRRPHGREDRDKADISALVPIYPGYDFYERNAKGRKIPIVILDLR